MSIETRDKSRGETAGALGGVWTLQRKSEEHHDKKKRTAVIKIKGKRGIEKEKEGRLQWEEQMGLLRWGNSQFDAQ